jgi:thioredoxin-related protein
MRILLLCLLLLLCIFGCTSTGPKGRIYIFCMPECSGCVQLEAELHKPAVQEKLKNFDVIYVEYNTKTPYIVSLYPTLIRTDSNGKEVKRYIGSMSEEELLKWLR